MLSISKIVAQIDAFVWGPVMLVLLVGTGVLLTVRCNFLTWRNLPWALKKTLSKEARTKSRGTGDVSPFSALTTALAATIGTGNIVGVATAMVSGGAPFQRMPHLANRHAPILFRSSKICFNG